MRLKVEFDVRDALPPKKDGANSMWRKHGEFERLLRLRAAAVQAFAGRPPLAHRIGLELSLYLPSNARAIGDLDNFITGVLDGLQAAAPQTPWQENPRWNRPEIDLYRPDRVVAIVDDCEVIEITARKILNGTADTWYSIVLEGNTTSDEDPS